MWPQQGKLNYLALLLALLLVTSSSHADAKRDFGRKKPSSSGGHRSPSSSGSKYSGSHVDPVKLSYSNHNTHVQRPSAPAASPPNIGWNVPKQQGPPPPYSRSDPIGGAKTNVHEQAPAYKPNNAPPPKYQPHPTPSNTNNYNYNRQANRNFTSSNGLGGGVHTNIAATNAHNVQSSYPRQQLPAGATYHSPGSLPAGATYHPGGSIPAGATYHPGGSIPAGATYHPGGSIPAGATYHTGGSIPAGATYYPSGSVPAGASYHPGGSFPAGGSYHPAASIPAGATYYQPGAGLPPGAVLLQQAPQKSGLGIGGSLAAGALGGVVGSGLTHLLMPSNTRTVEHVPSSNNQGSDTDKIVIINNGPPGSVTTQQVGSGTTIITTGQQQANAAAAPAAPPAAPPASVTTAPLAPLEPVPSATNNNAPLAPLEPVPSATNNNAPLAPLAGTAGAAVAPAADQSAAANQPPAGGIICVPVTTEEPDPADPTKTKPVERIACYPAPQPDSTPAPAPVPEGMVPLAPMNPVPSTGAPQPDLMKMPGEDKITSAKLAENSMLKTAASGSSIFHYPSFLASTLMTFLIAYCMH